MPKEHLDYEKLNPNDVFIVVESPNKAKTFIKHTGMDTMGTMGHFRDLPQKEMGIDFSTYTGQFVLPDDKAKSTRQRLISKSKGKIVLIAADKDREGEAIGFFTYQEIRKNAKDVYRILFDSVDKKSIIESIDNAIPYSQINKLLVDAFYARRMSDRLIGYILSPLATSNLSPDRTQTYSFGRVQSVAVRIIKEQEEKIENFTPEPFWKIKGLFDHPDSTEKLTAEHINTLPQKRFEKEEDAKALIEKLGNTPAIVESTESKSKAEKVPTPFILSTLQKAAEKKLGFDVEKLNKLAQKLKDDGLITYHRTDSVRINPDFIESIRELITKEHGAQSLPASPVEHKSKNSQADAHEAVRPYDINYKGDDLKGDEKALYDLIRDQTIASQMSPAVLTHTTMTLVVNISSDHQEHFTLKSKSIKDEGFYKVLPPSSTKVAFIPQMNNGDQIALEYETKEGATTPPPRFTEASLIEFMEKYGLARPSTFASLVKTIKARGYVSSFKEGSGKKAIEKLKCLKKGFELIDFAMNHEKFAWALNYKFTQQMESRLDDITEGKENYKDFLKEIHAHMGYLTQEDLRPQATKIENSSCPICGGVLQYTDKFLSCENHSYDSKTKTSQGCAMSVYLESGMIKTKFEIAQLIEILEGKKLTINSLEVSLNQKLIDDLKQGHPLEQFEDKNIIKYNKPSTGIKCPYPDCDGNILESNFAYVCEHDKTTKVDDEYVNKGCRFTLFKDAKFFETKITKEILKDLCDGKTVKMKNGNEAKLNLDAKFILESAGEKKETKKKEKNLSSVECPDCKVKLEKKKSAYECSNSKWSNSSGEWKNDGCSYKIWTNERSEDEIIEAVKKGERA